MACIDKASCGKENACDNIQIGDVVTVKETRGQGDGGVGVVRAINDDGTLRVKYTIGGGTARAVARADCRPGSHAGEHYEKKLTKWRERVDSFFARDDDEADDAFAARVAVLRLDDLVDKKSREQVEYVLDKVLAEPRPPIQIAFLQGAIPLQSGACFEKLLGALRGPRGGGGGGGFTAAAGRGSGGARKKEQVAWRRTGSSWLGRRVVLEPADGAAPVAATIDGYRPPAETKVRLDPHGPFVPLFRARFDDAALGVRADLYEADVEHAAAAALAAGLAAADDAQRAAPPAERCAPRIWSVNLGELSFGPLELGRLRDCFGDARCGVTHVFLECNNICCVPYDAESAADGAVREAARAVAARRRAERLDLRGAWKDLFRDLVRANRAKHDLYLLRDGDADQNAVVLQSVKNWFNPTGHGANKAWLARQKDGGGADAGAALLAAVATRHRRKEERRAAPGDRVRVLQAGGAWARGVVAPLAPTEAPAEGAGAAAEGASDAPAEGDAAPPTLFSVALDATPTSLAGQRLDASTFGATWRWDDEPERGDVVEYDLAHHAGVSSTGRRAPPFLVARDGLRRCVVVGARCAGYDGWRTCGFVDAGAARRSQSRVLRLPPLDTQGLARPVWRFQHAAGTTGAAAAAAYVRGRRRAAAATATPTPAPGLRVVCRVDGVDRAGVVENVGLAACQYASPEAAPAPVPEPEPAEPAPAPKRARTQVPRDARVGRWVEVYWAGDGEWFLGRVAGQREGKLKIAYTDGEALYQVLQDEPFSGDGDPPAPADGEPEHFRFAEAPPPPPPPPPPAPKPKAAPTDSSKLAKHDVIAVRGERATVLGKRVLLEDSSSDDDAPPPAPAPARGRRERKKPDVFAAGVSSSEYTRQLREAAEKRAAAALAATHHELEFADGRKEHVKLSRRAGDDAGDDAGAPWTFVERKQRKAPAPKKPKAAPKRKAAARKPPAAKKAKTPADEAKPPRRRAPPPPPPPRVDRPRRDRQRVKNGTDDLSSTELTRLLREQARTKAETCDVLLDEADGRPARGVRLRLGAKAFEEGLWRPETGSQRADGAPFVMQTESWEAAAIARRGGDAATRGRLRAKYKGVVFRDTDATFDEVRVVEDVVASGDGDYWELSTQLVDGGDDEPPLPYGIAALMPMVAAAPANLQTREVVFEIPKK